MTLQRAPARDMLSNDLRTLKCDPAAPGTIHRAGSGD